MTLTEPEAKRVSVDFSPRAYKRLMELKEATNSTTTSAVLRDALRIYLWAIEQQQDGFVVGAIKEEKDQIKIREVTLPGEI